MARITNVSNRPLLIPSFSVILGYAKISFFTSFHLVDGVASVVGGLRDVQPQNGAGVEREWRIFGSLDNLEKSKRFEKFFFEKRFLVVLSRSGHCRSSVTRQNDKSGHFELSPYL